MLWIAKNVSAVGHLKKVENTGEKRKSVLSLSILNYIHSFWLNPQKGYQNGILHFKTSFTMFKSAVHSRRRGAGRGGRVGSGGWGDFIARLISHNVDVVQSDAHIFTATVDL